jgi:ankyrin repeat protein
MFLFQFLVVSFLLFSGSNIDQSNSAGWTALHHACFHGHNETIKILIKSRLEC